MGLKGSVGSRGLRLTLSLVYCALHVAAQCSGGCFPPAPLDPPAPPPDDSVSPPSFSSPDGPATPPPAPLGALLSTVTCPTFGGSPFPASTNCIITVCPGLTLVMGTCDMPETWTCYGNDTVIALYDSDDNRIGAPHLCAGV